MIPRTFIDDLLNRVDIVDVISKSVTLKKSGSNLQGLCPFHQEKSPSFSVSETKQFYHCFGCGAHGSAINFLMEYAGLSFVDAIEDLASTIGLSVPKEAPSAVGMAIQEQAVALTEVMQKATNWYQESLKKNQRAIQYLKNRGLSGDIAKRYGIGYANDDWQNLEKVFGSYGQDMTAKSLVEAGLIIQGESEGRTIAKRYDRFRDRIMFPIRNLKGQVIGFGGRIIDHGEPKYLNSPETALFKKGHTLYGLFEARKSIREMSYVLVCEGYMDVVALAQLGFPNAVATLGTASTESHVQLLLRHSDKVVFSFDGDAAGVRAAKRAFEASIALLSDEKEIRFLFLPKEHDPDSFVREMGGEVFSQAISQAKPLSVFFIDIIGEGLDWNTAEGRAQAQNEAKVYFKKMPPIALRTQILRELAKRLGITQLELEQFYGIASVEVNHFVGRSASAPRVGALETLKKLPKKDWQKNADLRAMENLAKQKPVAPTDIGIQLMRVLIQYPLLGKRLSPLQCHALLKIALARNIQTQVIMQDLLELCRQEPEDGKFASFQNVLATSVHAKAYDALLKKVFETEFSLEEATLHLNGALKKVENEILKQEMLEITEKIDKNIQTNDDLNRYRAVVTKLKNNG